MEDREVPGLLRAAADGDRAAWSLLVDRYTPLLWAVSRGFRLGDADAGDAVQTTWLRLVEHIDRIDHPEQLGAWLATTARRECLRALRRRAREVPSETDDLEREDRTTPALDAKLLLEERDSRLWSAFELLSERCQRLLRVLMAVPPPSYDAVSAALSIPVGSIGPTRGRCLRQLRTLMEEAAA
jgi:RNA polymerase sigma factor (sigma-70 family)